MRHDRHPDPYIEKQLREAGEWPPNKPKRPIALFTRCGQFLCGTGPKWKEQFAAMLQIKTNTVDNMVKGDSRVPPARWREIAAFIQDRENEAPTLRLGALQAADPERDPQ
jgi:hypothetical protein